MARIVMSPFSGPYAHNNRRAALSSVTSVTDGFAASSKRSSAARLVCIRPAMALLDKRWDCISFSNCNATARLDAASSTSSRIPSALRKSSKLLPRYLFLFMATHVGRFSYLRHPQVFHRGFPVLLDETMQQTNLFVHSDKQCSRDPVHQSRAHFPDLFAEVVHQRFPNRPSHHDKQGLQGEIQNWFGGEYLIKHSPRVCLTGLLLKPQQLSQKLRRHRSGRCAGHV